MAYGQPYKTKRERLFSFSASYDGPCGGPTGDSIDAGEQIVMVDSVAWHAQCAENDGYAVVEGD